MPEDEKARLPADDTQREALYAYLREIDELLTVLDGEEALDILGQITAVEYGGSVDATLAEGVAEVENYDYDMATRLIHSLLSSTGKEG